MAMRHIRDPISGQKLVDDSPRPANSFRSVGQKVVYVNMVAPQAPAPPPSQAPTRAPSPVRSSTATSVSQVQYVPQSPSPPPTSRQPPPDSKWNFMKTRSGPGGPVYVNHGSPTPSWPTPRGRSPSPQRSQKPSYPEKHGPPPGQPQPRGPHQNPHGYHSRYSGPKHGSAYHTGQTYQGANWPKRRCCGLLWGILLILLLAGVAVGIYFLIQYLDQQAAANAPDVLNPGGTYVNGLYILTSTYSPQENLGIFGHDRVCNPFNNNTIEDDNITNPDCNTLTTRIVAINYTTTTTTLATTTASAHIITSGLCSLFASGFIFVMVAVICN